MSKEVAICDVELWRDGAVYHDWKGTTIKCLAAISDMVFSVFIILSDEGVAAGSRSTLPIYILHPEWLEDRVKIGSVLTLQEGPKAFGQAVVLRFEDLSQFQLRID